MLLLRRHIGAELHLDMPGLAKNGLSFLDGRSCAVWPSALRLGGARSVHVYPQGCQGGDVAGLQGRLERR